MCELLKTSAEEGNIIEYSEQGSHVSHWYCQRNVRLYAISYHIFWGMFVTNIKLQPIFATFKVPSRRSNASFVLVLRIEQDQDS